MKCIACGEDIIEDELGCKKGGIVSIQFGYGSENDMETWKGGIHDSCPKSIHKLVEIEDVPF